MSAMRLLRSGASVFSLTLFSHGGDGRLDIADKPKINGRAAANVFGVFVDLDFLHVMAGEELREGKVSAEH